MSPRSRLISFIAALSALLLILAVALPAGAAHHDRAKAHDKSGFSVYHGPVAITLADADSDGHQLGDLRVTAVETTTADGMPLGRLDATLTTTSVDMPAEGDETRISNLVFSFRDGKSQIIVGGTGTYPAQGPTLAIDTITVRPIVGGSGRFAGASGTAQSKHLDDDSWVHTFKLDGQGPRVRAGLRAVDPQRMRGLRRMMRAGIRDMLGERGERRGFLEAGPRHGRGFARGHDRDERGRAFGKRFFSDDDAKLSSEALEGLKADKADAKEARKEAKAAAKELKADAKAAKRAAKTAAADDSDSDVVIVDDAGATDDAPEEVGITRIDLGIASPAAAPGEQLGLWQYTIPAGSELDPHTHAGAQIAHIARGELEYTVFEGEGSIIHSDGSTTTIGPGTYVLKTGDSVVENPELVHQGANRTNDDVIIIAATLYEEGAPLALPVEEPAA